MLRFKTILFLSLVFSYSLYSQVPTDSIREFTIVDSFAWKVSMTVKVPTSVDSAILLISKSPISSTLSLTNQHHGIGKSIQTGIKVKKKFFSGPNTISFDINSLEANTDYYLAFFTFNYTVGYFYQAKPVLKKIRTKAGNPGAYYKSVDTNRAAFLSSLATLLKNHDMTTANYSDFRNVASEVYENDTFYNDSAKKYVLCSYSDIKGFYSGSFSFSATKFNREHTLPKNWMNFRGINNNDLTNYLEGADWHNLTLANETVNSQRSDFIFKVPHNPSSIGTARYYENKSKYTDTLNCFEPQNSYKGNAARCVFYMQVCYHRLLDSNWGLKNGLRSFAKNQSQDLLKQWSKSDVPDNREIARHEYIAFIQKNRNPFIDYPDWVDCIDFNTIQLLTGCKGLHIDNPPASIGQNTPKEWDIWYYPYGDRQYVLKLYYDKISNLEYSIYNLAGNKLMENYRKINDGENSISMDCGLLSKGTYLLVLKTEEMQKTLKLLVE